MRLRRMGIALVVLAVVGAACGGDGDDTGADGGISLNEPIGSSSAPDAEGPRRGSVAKSAFASMQVPEDDLDSAAQAVVDLATRRDVGGFLVSSVYDREEGHGAAHVIVGVPSDAFEGVVSELASIGEILRQELAGQDMSADVSTAHQELLRARARTADLIARLEATSDDAVAFKLQERLRSARATLRSARQEARTVGAEVALSRVEVALRATPPPPPAPRPAVERALATAKGLTLGIASAAVLIAGALVPILGLLLLLYVVGGPIVRRLRPRLQSWPG